MLKFMGLIFVYLMFFNHVYAISPGRSAVDFKLNDQNGKMISLSQFKGKYIILEWYNYGCPYVKKHYESQNMQTLQSLYKDNDLVVWLTITSSAKGKQGYFSSAEESLAKMKDVGSKAKHLLRDERGIVGQTYGARTTPQIVIIDHNFIVRYNGAIDSIASADKSDIGKAINYITSSMSKIMLGKKPSPQKTTPYGCSVKY